MVMQGLESVSTLLFHRLALGLLRWQLVVFSRIAPQFRPVTLLAAAFLRVCLSADTFSRRSDCVRHSSKSAFITGLSVCGTFAEVRSSLKKRPK
jgi:uncharacterized membrane protein